MKNTKDATLSDPEQSPPQNADLEGFKPSPPYHRIDDKAATLEEELLDTKVRFDRERFMYVFILAVLLVCALGPHLPKAILAFLIIATLVFVIAVGKYLDFPWAVVPLERWHELLFKYCEKRWLGKSSTQEAEPRERGDDEQID